MNMLTSSLNNEDELDYDDPPSNIQEEYVTTFWYLDRRVREKVMQNYPKIVFFCFHGGFCTYQCSGNEDVDLARINMHFEKKPDHLITREMLGPWKEKARQRRILRDEARRLRLPGGSVLPKMTGSIGVPIYSISKEANKQMRSLSPLASRSKSPSISTSSISRSPKTRTSSSRSPKKTRTSSSRSPNKTRTSSSRSPKKTSSRSPKKTRTSSSRTSSMFSTSSRFRRNSDSVEHSRSSSRRSRSPSRRSISPDRRSRSPGAISWSNRRRFSPPRGHRSTRSPSGKERTIRNPKYSGHNSSSRAARSNKRPAPQHRYSSKLGHTGRYNTRLDREMVVEEERQGKPQQWTCKRCAEGFHIQEEYIKHVELSNIRRKCPENELVVLDNSPPVTTAVKGEARPGPLYSGPPADILLDDSPPYIAPGSPEEPWILPPNLSDLLENVSDSDLPPIVPPPLLFILDPISDQSLPTTPTNTSPPVSLPDIPSVQTDPMASPPKFFEFQSKVILRSDGVLIFEDVLNESIVKNVAKLPKQMIKFAKNLFKYSVPDLVDIPTQTDEHVDSKTKQESNSTSAEVKDLGPPMHSNGQDSNFIENLLSANNLLMSLPDSSNVCQKSYLAKGVGKKQKLPQCFAEVEIEEPKFIKSEKVPWPNDEMELLLDKKRRKKLIKKKVKSKPKLNRVEKVTVKVSGVSYAGQVKPRNNQKFESAILQAETTSFKSKKKTVVSKKSNERRKYKDKDKNQIRSLPTYLETDLDFISQMPAELTTVKTPSSPDPRPDFVAAHSEPSTSHSLCEETKTSRSVTTEQTRLSSVLKVASSPSPSMSRSSSQTPSVDPTTKAAIYIPTSLSPTVPTSLSNSPTADIYTTSQAPNISLITDQSSPKASKTFPTLPFQVSSDPSSSALCFDYLAAKETVYLAQDQKNGKLQFVDPVLGIEYQMEWQLANSPEQSSSLPPSSSPVTTTLSIPTPPSYPPTPPLHQGEVMSLYQALGGGLDSEEEPEQPFIIRAGVDPLDKCPACNIGLDTGPKALNLSINFNDLSVLVDCRECGVRVRVKEVLGAKQRAFLSCGM